MTMNNESLMRMVAAARDALAEQAARYWKDEEYAEAERRHGPTLDVWLQELEDNNPPPIVPRHKAAIRAALPLIKTIADDLLRHCGPCDRQAELHYAYELAGYWLETTDRRRRKATP
jgi:hypothetical protein